MLGNRYPELDWKVPSWPGVRLAFLHSDRSTGDATVLIELAPNTSYPAHKHLGPEEVFVVAGSYRDAVGEYLEGSLQRFGKGSKHAPLALAEGALLLARVEGGIELLGEASTRQG